MIETLRRLISALVNVGLFEFIRRIGWKWALGAIAAVLAALLVVFVILAIIIATVF